MSDAPDMLVRHVIFSGAHLHLEYSGPQMGALGKSAQPRVVVAFPPFDYPPSEQADGWGSRSFTKRGIAHVCVFHRAEDWHQNDDFFDAMRACRDFLGQGVAVTTYGFSMGGYGAMLGAATVQADRVVAVSPQSSVDPKAVPFERRYRPQWAAMTGWKHDLTAQVQGHDAAYIVLYDPLHRLDRKHEALLPKPHGYTRCLLHGVGHAGLSAMIEIGLQETLFDLLRGAAQPTDLRQAFRQARKDSFRYLRKVGTRLHEKKHPKAPDFFQMARKKGFRRLTKKWRPFYAKA